MDISQLKGRLPDAIFNQLPDVIDTYEINTRARMSNFMGQCHHESEGFKDLVENLNYSGTALMGLFRSHFEDEADAGNYARHPEMIANRIYANRMGNGDEASGDGWKYRGKGCIQITGRTNTEDFFEAMGIDAAGDPMLIVSDYPLISAAWFWNEHKLNDLADAANHDAVRAITKIINGGENGLEDRMKWVDYYSTLVTD